MFRRGCVSLRGGARAEHALRGGHGGTRGGVPSRGRTAEAAATARATVDAWFEAAAASALGATLPKTITKKQIATPPGIELPYAPAELSDWADALESVGATYAKGDDGAVADADAALAAGLVRALAAKGGEGSMTRAKELGGRRRRLPRRRRIGERWRARGDFRAGWRDDEGIEVSSATGLVQPLALKAWRDRAGC